MALHIVPDGETHVASPECPCGPTVGPEMHGGSQRQGYRHNLMNARQVRVQPGAAVVGSGQIDVSPNPQVRVELVRNFNVTPEDTEMTLRRLQKLVSFLPPNRRG